MVRFTNREVICQVRPIVAFDVNALTELSPTLFSKIIYAKIDGDYVLGQARSTELANYGLAAGYKNYPASYATGLLLARRVSNPTSTL